MPGEFGCSVVLGEFTEHTGSHGCPLDEASHLLTVQSLRPDQFPTSGHTPEKRAVGDSGELEPHLQSCDRAGGVR